MKRSDAKKGMRVRSRANTIYKGAYRIVKCLKTVCWVETLDNKVEEEDGRIRDTDPTLYRNVPYHALVPA